MRRNFSIASIESSALPANCFNDEFDAMKFVSTVIWRCRRAFSEWATGNQFAQWAMNEHSEAEMRPLQFLSFDRGATGRRFRIPWTIASIAVALVVSAGQAMSADSTSVPAISQLPSVPVIGDLGGIPVTIPRHFANNVEYDHDPGFGVPRSGVAESRTYRSRLRSFGFDVRFPDMAGLSDDVLRKDKALRSVYNTSWIRVGVNTGEDFPGDGALDRLSKGMLGRPDTGVAGNATYVPFREDAFGLDAFALTGIDTKTGKPFRQHGSAHDVFVHKDANGKVDAFIRCSNRPHEAAPCKHWFSLEPSARALVYVGYRRGMLRDWAEIQRSVSHLLLSFRAPSEDEKESQKFSIRGTYAADRSVKK